MEIGEDRLAVHSPGNIKVPSNFFNLVLSVAELIDAGPFLLLKMKTSTK
jgi:hypothetical protein